MKYSQLEEALFEIREKIAELDQQRQILKQTYSLPKTMMWEGYTFSARWRVSPDEGMSYTMQFHREKILVIEVVQGELYKAAAVPSDVFKRAQEVKNLLEQWLTDRIDWPFSQEEFPRVQ